MEIFPEVLPLNALLSLSGPCCVLGVSDVFIYYTRTPES